MKTEIEKIITNLDKLIFKNLGIAGSEQRYPGRGADESDDLIKDSLDKAKEYRRIRDEIENISSGAILR